MNKYDGKEASRYEMDEIWYWHNQTKLELEKSFLKLLIPKGHEGDPGCLSSTTQQKLIKKP
jgi:hypothetical protein